MRRSSVFLLCVFLLGLAILTVLYVREANVAILEPAGPVAVAEKNIIVTATLLCSLVALPVFFLLFFFAWKYRAGTSAAEATHSPDWDHDSVMAELIWWLVPAAIIVILGVIAVQSSNALDPYKPLASATPAIKVDVVSLEWKWLFIYPEQGIASVNLVEFPVDTPIHFYLTSDAPMNTFWIPQLSGQIVTMPGMTTQLNLAANRAGDFRGFSGNISGTGFAGMAFTARAVSTQEFAHWVASVKASSTPLTGNVYSMLAEPSEYDLVTYYAPVDPNLFEAIESKYMNRGASSMNP